MHVGTAFDLYITSYDFYGESKQGASLSVSILFCKGSERVLTVKNADLFINETDYADLDMEDADAHLSSALRFRTTSYIDTSRIDYAQFTAFHDFLKRTYPHVLSASEWEEIGYSLLIRIPGSDPSLKPALFMAHQDVVPVVPGTEQDWLHDPFSGDIADGFIWGRGAMDIKEMLIGILESAEYLLSHGRQFRRSVYLAFGEDEETVSVGAVAICKTLEKRGVELEYVLDESSADVLDAADYGAPGTLVCTVGTYEKGYADMKLTACSRGGHSSNPFRGTSLQTRARQHPRRSSDAPDAREGHYGDHGASDEAASFRRDPKRSKYAPSENHGRAHENLGSGYRCPRGGNHSVVSLEGRPVSSGPYDRGADPDRSGFAGRKRDAAEYVRGH